MSTQTSCPNAASLKELLVGTLPETVQAALTGHVETCANCQQKLEQLSAEPGLGSGLRQMAGEHLNEEAGLRQALDELQEEKESTPNATQQFREGDLPLDFLSPSEKPGHLGKLGHYDVLELIGRGGMGIVLRAFDESLHRVVAIKVMAPELAANATARKRFVREAQAAAAIRDDHVINIYAVEEANPVPYLVMEYISGKSLQERLDESGPLELKEILRIGMQTANGLAAAHAQGLIHRDIKPANILMENGVERVKITDFGLARAVDDASISQSGIVAGTPQFMAPEQARGEHLDHRADLFSLGSMLYAMCTGRAPFRAHNTVAVLRRVSDDLTRPIREINPDIPDWLVAIVDKLHAKEPEDRYQTAAEVAELLGQHLAQLQQPGRSESVRELERESAKPGAPTLSRTHAPTPTLSRSHAPTHRRRWVIAAAVLLVLIGSLVITEATGVTKITDFVATTLRITTPEGTLIVEVDDPNVKVTIEGDGGLVITGAGPQEVRLKPGSYKVEASKDGKPVKSEVVTITRNGKKVVTVQIEGPPAGAAGRDEKQPFVILGRKGVAERKYDTLAEAVQSASDGDTIEVRGNGPFITQPISINDRALVIRAGKGFWPVIKADPDEPGNVLLQSNSLLVLEGLDLQWVEAKPFDPSDPRYPQLVGSNGPTARLYAVNCRFLMNRREGLHHMSCIGVWDAALCHLRNCQHLVGGHGTLYPSFGIRGIPNTTVMVDNCLTIGTGIMLHLTHAEPTKVVLNHNTFLGPYFVHFYLWNKIDPPGGEKESRPFQIVSSANIFGGQMPFVQSAALLAKEKVLSAKDTERLLTRLVGWQENRNFYFSPEDSDLLGLIVEMKRGQVTTIPPTVPITTLPAWKTFWGMEELDSQRGQAKFQGGDLVAKAKSTPERILPEDFRLRADSAGYRAGKDGKDLGADVDLVGPGPAYERWKKTPEYQQWLKDTGQLRAEAPKPEPKAFVVLGGKGVAERKFDTLAEAVQNASDGDTIEVRGNGPFTTEPIKTTHAITIRAGEGFRPVVRLSAEGLRAHAPILVTEASLVLEGLEFQRLAPERKEGDPWRFGFKAAKALHIANCRFLMKSTEACLETNAAVCELRNSEFLCHGSASSFNSYDLQPGQRLVVENCLLTAGCEAAYRKAHARRASVRFTRNTFLTAPLWFYLWFDPVPNLEDVARDGKVEEVEASDNVFDGGFVVKFTQYQRGVLPVVEAEKTLAGLLDWKGERNLFPTDGPLVRLGVVNKGLQEPANPVMGLAAWRKFWGTPEANSIEGRVKYQGGDLLAKLRAAPEKLTPEDFRLRPDSAGYKAGKDGKDLGADVDLVGPGAAYERWKKTPEYQQWLKDTGQLRAEAPKPEPKAFVVLGGKGVAESKFDTLAEAARRASSGDTIEIRGNGPFFTDPLDLGFKVLTIRAGSGYAPVIKPSPAAVKANVPLLKHQAALTLEGLELHHEGAPDAEDGFRVILYSVEAPVYLANCKLVVKPGPGIKSAATTTSQCPAGQMRNCLVLSSPGYGPILDFAPRMRWTMDNCLILSDHAPGCFLQPDLDNSPGARVRLTRNTLVSNYLLTYNYERLRDTTVTPVVLETEENVCKVTRVFALIIASAKHPNGLPDEEQLQAIPKLVRWQERGNVYGAGPFLYLYVPNATGVLKDLSEWDRFWGLKDTGSVEGPILLRGNPRGLLTTNPEAITPDDFRLRSDSAGYRAGKDGKDLGADVDLVGPGAAYERWKQTPEYQQWLKDTGQAKSGQ